MAALLEEIRQHDTDYETRYGLVMGAMYFATRLGWPAGYAIDPTAELGFQVVAYIEAPTGQLSWHMPEHVIPWDGHTTEQKYERVQEWIAGHDAAHQAERAQMRRRIDALAEFPNAHALVVALGIGGEGTVQFTPPMEAPDASR